MKPGRASPPRGQPGTAAVHPERPRSHPPPTGRLSPYSPFEQFLAGVTVTGGDGAEPLWLQPPGVFLTTLRSLVATEVRMLEVPGLLAPEVTALGQRAAGRCRRAARGLPCGVLGERMLVCSTWEGKWGPGKVCVC